MLTNESKYLLLTEFEGRTVSYGPSFFPTPIEGEKRGSVTYSTDKENEISNVYYISTVSLTGSGTISFTRNGFKSPLPTVFLDS